MKHQGLQRSAVIDIQGLTALWDFGWLRPQELGRLLWPEATHQVKYAERIARRWSEKGLVLSRKLPAHNGTAMVLSESGARLLRESIGVAAQSGKDWGETRNGAWMAPRWWRHDLIANSLLSILAASGHHVIPERKLRRENRSAKIPDGLAISPNRKDIFWIEIESARKSGGPMREMAHHMARVATGKAPKEKLKNIEQSDQKVYFKKTEKKQFFEYARTAQSMSNVENLVVLTEKNLKTKKLIFLIMSEFFDQEVTDFKAGKNIFDRCKAIIQEYNLLGTYTPKDSFQEILKFTGEYRHFL